MDNVLHINVNKENIIDWLPVLLYTRCRPNFNDYIREIFRIFMPKKQQSFWATSGDIVKMVSAYFWRHFEDGFGILLVAF